MHQQKFFTTRSPTNTITVRLNQKYEVREGEEFHQTIQYIVQQLNYKNSKKAFHPDLEITFFSSLEFLLGKHKMEDEKCTICLCEFEIRQIEKEIQLDTDDDTYALACSHIFHRGCLTNMIAGKYWVKCPVCSSIFGKMLGDMPDGRMKVTVDNQTKCEGYPPGTIIIHYSFGGCNRNGIQIPGTSRTAYLPNTPEGKEVLNLLRQSFDRKLTFTVGRSVTTGMDNQIVWNGIHHKTSLSGGSSHFGYPDPTYLKRVKEELAAKGIVVKKYM